MHYKSRGQTWLDVVPGSSPASLTNRSNMASSGVLSSMAAIQYRDLRLKSRQKVLRGLPNNSRGEEITKRSPSSTLENELTQRQTTSLDQHQETTTMEPTTLLGGKKLNRVPLIVPTDCSEMAFLLDGDDDQAFEAALSFVEEFKLDDTGTGVPSSARQDATPSRQYPVAAGKNARAAIDAKRANVNARKKLLRQAGIYSDPNRARNERTREIAFLREQIDKLQLDLQVLQTNRQTHQGAGVHQPSGAVLVSRHSDSQVSSMWQEQAVRMQRRREEAERDNVRLRLAVERQRKVANNLEYLMKKRSNQLTNECASLMNLCCSRRDTIDVLDFCGDIEDFEGLLKRVDDAHRNVDAVFAANGLARSTISPGDVHMREGVDGKFLEFSSYKVLPYEVRAATEAVWEHFKGVEKHLGVGSIYNKAAKNLDEQYTIVEDFSIEIYSNSSRADYKTKQVVRRYVEEDRDIVIWVSHATPVEVKHKLLSGLSYNFLGYAIARRASTSASEQELTQLQLCSRISLDQETETTYSADSARTLANFLIVHAAKNIVAHRESIENSLADRVLRRRLQ